MNFTLCVIDSFPVYKSLSHSLTILKNMFMYFNRCLNCIKVSLFVCLDDLHDRELGNLPHTNIGSKSLIMNCTNQ